MIFFISDIKEYIQKNVVEYYQIHSFEIFHKKNCKYLKHINSFWLNLDIKWPIKHVTYKRNFNKYILFILNDLYLINLRCYVLHMYIDICIFFIRVIFNFKKLKKKS